MKAIKDNIETKREMPNEGAGVHSSFLLSAPASEFAQRSLGWYRARLGYFTGSRVGVLTGRKRGSTDFNDTAMAYVYEVAATRYMNNAVVEDDDLFTEYLNVVNFETRAMRFGVEQEAAARRLYAAVNKVTVTECGSVESADVEYFSSSPDGIVTDGDGAIAGCIEIKCPKQATYMKYRAEIQDNATLSEANKEYYYQVQSHLMVTGAEWCDFIAYCPYQLRPLHVVRITPDSAAFEAIRENVSKANAIIDSLK